MSERKLLPVEVEAEGYARDLLQWFALAKMDERMSGVTPLEAMQAAAQLRRMSATIVRLERDLATERRLHRDTEKRAELYKTERDVARRERDRKITVSIADLWTATGSDLDALSMGVPRDGLSDHDYRDFLIRYRSAR